jgi:hypothetical protein
MPFFGLGLHILIAVYFAVHAVRTGQQMYWLLILFSFPLLGSVVYFFSIYMQASGLDHSARKAVNVAARTLDPGRELREARAAFDYTPTAQNQMRLAQALLEAGDAAEAASNYEACLKGPFSTDLEIKFGAARAYFESGRFDRALVHLNDLAVADAGFRAEPVSLLKARTLAGLGQGAEARAEFEAALHRFGSFDTRAEYLIWALGQGDLALAGRLQQEVDQATKRWNRRVRELNMPLLKRLEAAANAARAKR